MSEHTENTRRSFGRHTSATKQAEAEQVGSTETLAQAGMTTDEHSDNSGVKRETRKSADRGFGQYASTRPNGTSETRHPQ